MKLAFGVLFAFSSLFSVFTPSKENEIRYLNTREGSQRLIDSKYRESYWQLSIYYDTQKEPTHCGVASAVMVLNALGIDRPPWRENSAYKMYMQEHFFSPEVEKFLTRSKAAEAGIDIGELARALETFNVDVQVVYAPDLTVEKLRSILKESLSGSDQFVILNYFRPSVKQNGKGHFSPVAAYDTSTDTVLIMDVARYRYPPVWAPLGMLLESMQVLDEDTGGERGILIVSAKKSVPS